MRDKITMYILLAGFICGVLPVSLSIYS